VCQGKSAHMLHGVAFSEFIPFLVSMLLTEINEC
jgi:hypothetical protein